MQISFLRKFSGALRRILVVSVLWSGAFGLSLVHADPAALMEAVRAGQLDAVRILLEQKERVDLRDRYGYTLLHYAASLGHTEIGALLIAHGAEVDARADQELTPLMIAAMEGHVEVVQMLVNQGGQVDSRNFKEKVTPLWAASKLGRVDVVKTLLALGADASFVDGEGKTALQSAHTAGHTDVVQVLKNHDASHH